MPLELGQLTAVQLLEDVYQIYAATRSSGVFVPWVNTTPDLAAVRVGLPALLTQLVANSGRDPALFAIYGSVGEPNRTFARIPWVAVSNLKVSDSTKRGYYIVLLFRDALDGCYLSLNQGYTQFREAFQTKSLATAQVRASARRCLEHLDVEPGFVSGPIDLDAKTDLGKGYEQGAIVSRWYPRGAPASEAELGRDLSYLLDLYDRMIRRVGTNLSLAFDPISEDSFQVAAGTLARSNRILPPLPTGPQPPPPRCGGGGGNRYRRDAVVAASAQRRANFQCEVDPLHATFISRVSGANFVEAHHLVPMSLQPAYSVSLDVVENLIILCPTCHRLLHHGKWNAKKPILDQLLTQRHIGLAERGINVIPSQLRQAYSEFLEDQD